LAVQSLETVVALAASSWYWLALAAAGTSQPAVFSFLPDNTRYISLPLDEKHFGYKIIASCY
tara:strand:+ start:2800 stop:2985 length:186 start_codon:yes stop_codon:yes gene_type:complete